MKLIDFVKKNIWLITVAISIRLLVSAFLYHPDIKTIAFQTSFLKSGVVDIYSYLTDNKQSLTIKEDFVYFPLTYFTIGGYQAFVSPLLGDGFNQWVSDAGANSTVNNSGIFRYLVLLKLPLIFADLAIAFLLMEFFKHRKNAIKVFELWLLNPFTIILIYAFSNIDLYTVLLTLISLLLFKRKRLLASVVILGLAISFKLYPLLFVPFYFLSVRSVKEKMQVTVVPLVIFVLSLVPLWSKAFVNSALISGLSTRMFSPNFEIGFGESIIVGLLLITSLFFYGFLIEKKLKLFNYLVSLILIIFSFSHFHISWLLWIAPFLIVLAIKNDKLKWPIFIWAIIAITIPLLYSDRSMTLSLFRIYTNWFDLLPTPFTVVNKFYDAYGLQSILHSALAGISMVIVVIINTVKKNTK